MTLYALIADGATVTTTATLPPTGARRIDTGAWVTPPADGWTPDLLAACGWLLVTEVPRPADTATTTSDPAPVALVAGVPTQQWTVRPWTLAELSAPHILTDLEERLSRVEAHLWPPDPPPTDTTSGRTWEQLGGAWPHDTILAEGGRLWRNVAGVPLTTPPSGFPGSPAQWTRLYVEVAKPDKPAEPGPTVAAWSATATYKVDDRCTKGGRLYACKVAHGAEYQGTWAPPTASVWTDVGPA